MAQNYVETQLRHIRLERAGRTVLRDVDWVISPGERWILAGGNGAGKTQLLKLIEGSVWPAPTGNERRRYLLGGEVYETPLEVKEEIAYLGPERQDKYERYGWNPTAELVVGTGLHRTDIPLDPLTARDRRSVAARLRELSLTHLAQREFLTLSYGERRLVLLARALAARPKLLLLDELLTGLDAGHRAAALAWLDRTGRSRLPWVLATHRMEDVPRSASHALVLEAGRIVYRGRISRAPLERWLAPRAGSLGPGTPEPRAHRAAPERSAPARRARAPWRAARHPAARRRMLIRMVRASVYLGERRVLENLSLEIDAGQCWVIHGPNGSGKSTLLRTLYGDHAVAAGGLIERAGIEPGVPLDEFKRGVGLIAPHVQSCLASTRSILRAADAAARLAASPGDLARRHLEPQDLEPQDLEPQDLTVSEAVQSGRCASIGLDAPPSLADRRAAARALADFGLARFAGRSLRELSYGQLRRVLFARAWVSRPRLLLLDEPFAGVDARTRGDLLAELAAALAAGTTVVMATHHREEWPSGATHELELAAGRSRYSGPVRERGGRLGNDSAGAAARGFE